MKKNYTGKYTKKVSHCFNILAVVTLACMLTVSAGCQSEDSTAQAAQQQVAQASTSTVVPSSTPTAAPSSSANNTEAITTPVKLDLITIAQQVIAGQWGNGQDRINALTAAGYDADAVQAEVDKLLDYTAAATDVISGKYGNGETRAIALKDAGYDADKVQDAVNEMLNMAASDSEDEPIIQQQEDTAQKEDSGQSSDKGHLAGDTWHDEITEPIYDNQPVYKWNYSYTITKYVSENIDQTISGTSGFTYDDQDTALAAAKTDAQAALIKVIPTGVLEKSNYFATSAEGQTGTKRVQTGTRVVQKAGWY